MAEDKSTRALTKATVSNPPIPPAGKRLNLWDSTSSRGGVKGLCLRVTSTGVATWYAVYRGGDNRKVWYALGRARDADGTVRLTLSTARDRARAHLGRVAAGTDLRAERDAKRADARGEGTLRALLDDYAGDHLANARDGVATRARIERVWAALLAKKLSAITEMDIARVRRERLKTVTPATWNRDYTVLRGLYGWALHKARVASIPLNPKVHKAEVADDRRVRWLGQHDPDEEARLLAALDARPGYLRVLVRLALWTGCRRGELFSLRWGAVDLDRAQVTVEAHTAKSAKKRVVPLPAPAVEMLREWRPERAKPGGLVTPNPATGERLVTVKKAWAALCADAKVEAFRLHDCRHHYATKLVLAGVPIFTVASLLGHANPQLTADRYAHLSDAHKADAVNTAFC